MYGPQWAIAQGLITLTLAALLPYLECGGRFHIGSEFVRRSTKATCGRANYACQHLFERGIESLHRLKVFARVSRGRNRRCQDRPR